MNRVPRTQRSHQSGAALVEFALVALVLYLLLAAILGLGRWMVVSQAAQEAARIAAREIALYPLPPEFTFQQALDDVGFRQAVYDPDFLVVDLDVNDTDAELEAFFAGMPVVNRALRPLMINSTADVGGELRRLLHVPGALVDSATSPSGLTVVIPRVQEDEIDPDTGQPFSIALIPVLEEVGDGSFSMASPDRGLVAVRLNVPYQSATLSAYVASDDLNPEGEPFQDPVLAIDPLGGGYEQIGPGPEGSGPYSGAFGLGEHQSLGTLVRPFRRLVSAQALFRREVFL